MYMFIVSNIMGWINICVSCAIDWIIFVSSLYTMTDVVNDKKLHYLS